MLFASRLKGVLAMFVVHTVNQLEEAVRLGAEEILVTGTFANSVRDVFLFKSDSDIDTCPAAAFPADAMSKIEHIAEKSGVPPFQLTSIMIISGDYSLLDAHPCMLLQKQCSIKT